MKGKVKFFDLQKEFGFIVGDDGKEYFVHKKGLQEGVMIDKEDLVTFETEKGDRGIKAIKVSKEE
jgi:CspA family cold shock protein